MDLTHKQTDVLYRVYDYYLGKPNDDRTPRYFEFVSELEVMETWYPLVKSRLVMLLDWCDSYDPFGKILYVKLAPHGNKFIDRFLKAIRRVSVEQLPELLASEFGFISAEAERRLQRVNE